MIIYTNDGNPLTLKLLISANVANKKVQVKKIAFSDPALKEPKHLPTLELDSGVQIFSTNAAVKFLLPVTKNESLNDQWLDWSSTRLAPALAHNFAVGHRADPDARAILNALVKTLEDHLAKVNFLTGDQVSSADWAVWSLLAPDGTLKGAQNIDNLLRWYRAVREFPAVQEALKVLPLKELHFNSLVNANRFGGVHHIVLDPKIGDSNLQLLNPETPTISDTVLPEEMEAARENFVPVKEVKAQEPRVVLPKKGERNVLITSALPYVNNVPHLGNIIGCVLSADIFARYARLCGYNTLYVCGTDEYGTATETKALAENMTPRQICDKYFEIHNSIYRWFGIGFDYFGRTSTQEQTQIVQEMFKELQAAGMIETQTVEQLLCQKCDRFLADRFVEGTCPHPGCGYEDARGDQCDGCGKLVNAIELVRPRCKVCNNTPVVRQSKQFFIDLPKIEPKLKSWVDSVEQGWTNNARVITRTWLKEGLRSRCITRDLKWGIPVPVPGFESKVFYVWFDAPIGYLSITSKYTKDWKQWWQPASDTKVELFQFMAKDNVPFHSVMFPATLLGINKGHTMVSNIMATEYLNYEDGKFSKSRGIGVFGNDAQETGIPSDVWRFYLAAARPEGQDSSFSWNDLAARNNSELLNNLGNFCNRALVFCEKNFASTIPVIKLEEDELILLALVNRELKGYIQSLEKARLRDGIRHLLSISRHGNQYMQSQQPWVLAKGDDKQKTRAGTVIGLACNMACLLATLLFPYMPDTARNLFKQLNVQQQRINPEKSQMSMLLKEGHKIGKPTPLFTKIEQTTIDELKKKYAGVQQGTGAPAKKETTSNKLFDTVEECERAVADQGEKVRKLKGSGVEKAVWQPEVTILLELKKQLENLKLKLGPGSAPKAAAAPAAATPSPNAVKELEDKITKQGEKVRLLKGSSDKSVWQPEVEVLLGLKKQLAELTGQPLPAPSGKSNKKKK
ncbi:methionine--tRNA ligase, cytoplasmic [Culicoides brevitarsis]|uniref:methionine--tRNA ligase, cytoplasmic n=1 Tax=Culicoides brevitarsis TaxID=469753 RepID=UPI00307B6F55